MKELTIEEKAKAYDEALETARKINSGEGVATPSGWTVCEVIFPELKESEDDKIRKCLIDYFGDFHLHTFAGLDPKKIIAWLKKQGEYANFRNKIQVGDKVTRSEDGMLVNLSQLNRVAKPADKIEQKIATWSEEDKKMCQETIDWFEKKCFPYALENENPARESINWLKSLKSRKQWKPSKEQMEALWNVYEGGEKQSALASLYNDLKKLKG